MNYTLKTIESEKKVTSTWTAIKNFWVFLRTEQRVLALASITIIVNSGANLLSPVIIGYAIDHFIQTKQYAGLLWSGAGLGALYLIALGASYAQTRLMGGVGQRVLFNLRAGLFDKIQALPVAFFNQNKAGDLISRINNDTDKLNQFFSQTLMQFIGNIFIMIGAGIFLVYLKPNLGLAALVPALLMFVFNRLVTPWVKQKNDVALQSTGALSAEIQESLSNFKVIVAFNRRDYFRTKFSAVNTKNYMAAVGSGIANSIFTPVYGLASVVAQFIVLTYGVYLITEGSFTIGLLVGFLAYVNSFYNPLRQIAALWANLQLALSAWNRISTILGLESTLKQVADSHTIEKIHATETAVIRFNNVHFRYGETEVLHDVSFNLEKGKTYALVGPTGGGKTTTASLIARLYDPTEGTIHLNGQDIRSYTALERTHKIGFILQEPFLFTGTVRENILYGNTEFKDYTNPALEEMLRGANLTKLIERFEKGLDTLVGSSETMSLGERQLIAFIRAVIRRPEILILDEATANIDTVTEELLEEILKQLPKETTKVIIAHRLNTIENADEIFFVNDRKVVPAGSLDHAVEMLLHNSRKS